MSDAKKTATDEFKTSSTYDYSGTHWRIRNIYPEHPDPADQKPWLSLGFKTDSPSFASAVKKYILEGITSHNIDAWNTGKRWYHAAWLHYGSHGREPVNGLVYAGSIAPRYLGKYQDRYLQGWLNSYYNGEAATALHKIWENPEAPNWEKGVHFPDGSLIFEAIFVDYTEGEISYLKDAPVVEACIAVPPSRPDVVPDTSKRLTKPVPLRLIQLDFRARVTGAESPTGWVFGTFIHDSTKAKLDSNPWEDLIPVGIQWGNDPSLDQKAHDEGKVSSECWINTRALDIINSQKGDKPWLGWHGRLNGPADDFISTCSSCHAFAQLVPDNKEHSKPTSPTQPEPKKVPPEAGKPGVWIQEDKSAIDWFRNVEAGKPFDEGLISTDYSWHVKIGIQNYRSWRKSPPQRPATALGGSDLSSPRAFKSV